MGQQVCAPWTTPDKLCNEGDGTTTDCVDGVVPLDYSWSDEDLILAASNILHGRTCYRFPGVCEYSVWPCIDVGCFSAYHECVPCVRMNVIVLPSDVPVVSITEITEDGVPLDPAAYRLERGRVVRLDGEPWQRNTFGLPNVTTGVETIVTYEAGVVPPIELQIAAADLAGELKKSCNGQSCALDPRVASFVRRGVAVELTDLKELLKSGATGIPSVDYALSVHGGCEQGSATMLDPARPYRGQPVVS